MKEKRGGPIVQTVTEGMMSVYTARECVSVSGFLSIHVYTWKITRAFN